MSYEPGSYWAYCPGGSNLVGAAVATAAKTWLPEVWDRTIARPMQFGRYYYNLMPTGEGYTGGGVFMRPRDLLKIGQLYLDGGMWNGKRIVSKDWVAQSTAKRIAWEARGENARPVPMAMPGTSTRLRQAPGRTRNTRRTGTEVSY